jgi:hypothetical protein
MTTSFDYKVREMRANKMRCIFLVGILCGVIMAAGVTFVFAIPANNDHWRVEITKRGGEIGISIKMAILAGCGQLNRSPILTG